MWRGGDGVGSTCTCTPPDATRRHRTPPRPTSVCTPAWLKRVQSAAAAPAPPAARPAGLEVGRQACGRRPGLLVLAHATSNRCHLLAATEAHHTPCCCCQGRRRPRVGVGGPDTHTRTYVCCNDLCCLFVQRLQHPLHPHPAAAQHTAHRHVRGLAFVSSWRRQRVQCLPTTTTTTQHTCRPWLAAPEGRSAWLRGRLRRQAWRLRACPRPGCAAAPSPRMPTWWLTRTPAGGRRRLAAVYWQQRGCSRGGEGWRRTPTQQVPHAPARSRARCAPCVPPGPCY